MNPFLESTVAQPQALPPLAAGSARPSAPRGVRWRQAASRLALATGVGLAGGLALAQSHAGPPVNVNIANMAELQTVRGIGPKTAALIVHERERAGPFTSFQDFTERVRGIGPKKAAALQAQGVGVSSSSSSAPPGMSGR
ncbi:MAG: ComEA family DNA-binding protein [Pigmentiphaga sp.]